MEASEAIRARIRGRARISFSRARVRAEANPVACSRRLTGSCGSCRNDGSPTESVGRKRDSWGSAPDPGVFKALQGK